MIHPVVQLLYCMFLNKGRVCQGCVQPRMSLLPITITDAQSTIEVLCRELERNEGAEPNAITVNKITTNDFVHFRRPKYNIGPPSKQMYRPIKVKHDMTGPFRRKQ